MALRIDTDVETLRDRHRIFMCDPCSLDRNVGGLDTLPKGSSGTLLRWLR
jgi:hypothetical protein